MNINLTFESMCFFYVYTIIFLCVISHLNIKSPTDYTSCSLHDVVAAPSEVGLRGDPEQRTFVSFFLRGRFQLC